jgi:hypothetical protein
LNSPISTFGISLSESFWSPNTFASTPNSAPFST